MAKYLGTKNVNSAIFQCPGADAPRLNKYDGGTRSQNAPNVVNYSYNEHISCTGPLWDYPNRAWARLSQIKIPSDFVIVMDTQHPPYTSTASSTPGPGYLAAQYGYSGATNLWGLSPWHNGYCTLTHADGHADAASVVRDWQNSTNFSAWTYRYISPSGTINVKAPNPPPLP